MAPLLETIGIDTAFRDMTVGYVQMITLGAPGMFIFLALRFTTEGIGVTKPIMYTSIFALVCNVFLNWVFMFGNLGAPAMGAVGCGLASGITMWVIAIVLVVYMFVSPAYKKAAAPVLAVGAGSPETCSRKSSGSACPSP